MKPFLTILVLLTAAIVVMGCSQNESSNDLQIEPNGDSGSGPTPGVQSYPVVPSTQGDSASSIPPKQQKFDVIGSSDCKLLLSTDDLNNFCPESSKRYTLVSNVEELGVYVSDSMTQHRSICGQTYKKTDNSGAVLAGVKIIVYSRNTQSLLRDVCVIQNSERISGIGDKACTMTRGYTEIGFEKGDYYVYLGPMEPSVTFPCTTEQFMDLAKTVASRI